MHKVEVVGKVGCMAAVAASMLGHGTDFSGATESRVAAVHGICVIQSNAQTLQLGSS